MFRQKTLFVLGAGASYELGLPTGEQLKSTLAGLLNITFPSGLRQETGDYDIAQLLRCRAEQAGEQSWNHLLHKCWLIRDALPGALSIDNLLDAHASDQDLVFCGKVAIAKAILDAERSSRLFKTDSSDRRTAFQLAEGTWLVPFFQMLTENVRKENVLDLFENVVVINFNYDRCLEHFIPLALQSYYGFDAREAAECMSTATIVHPYGKVGDLEPKSGHSYATFGADRYNLEGIAAGIRTFAEGLTDPELGSSIEATCKEAHKVIFLGYAFHPLNMQLLATETSADTRKVFGTTLGLSDAARKVVQHTILQTFKKNDPSSPKSSLRVQRDLDEMHLDPLEAVRFLESHFRGIV